MTIIEKLPNFFTLERERKNNIHQLKVLIDNYLQNDKKEVIDKIKTEQSTN